MTVPPGPVPSHRSYHGSWTVPPTPNWPAAGSSPYGYGMAPPRTSANGFAIASMVLGIVWIYWIGSALAVVFGHIALRQMRRNPYEGGRGMAIAGLVLGYVGIGIVSLLIVVVVVASQSSRAGTADVGEARTTNL